MISIEDLLKTTDIVSTWLPRELPARLPILKFLVFVVLFLYMVFQAISRSEDSDECHNIFLGLCFALYLSVATILLLRQESLHQAWSFTRISNSNSIFWKLVCGMSVIYLVFLGFIVFQNRKQIINILVWFWPYLKIKTDFKEYDMDCGDFRWNTVKPHIFDFFAVAHFLGWAVKVPIARSYGLLWTLSIAWEITEVFFTNLTRHFAECWWDAIFLDIFFCNLIGIFLGMNLCKLFKIKPLLWKKNIKKDNDVNQNQIKLQDISQLPHLKIVAGFYCIICLWQISEMNSIYMRDVLQLTIGHPVTAARVLIMGLTAIPAISQFHAYIINPEVKILGISMWIFLITILMELLIILKFGLINIITRKNIVWPILWALFMLPYSALFYCAILKYGRPSSTSEEFKSRTIDI